MNNEPGVQPPTDNSETNDSKAIKPNSEGLVRPSPEQSVQATIVTPGFTQSDALTLDKKSRRKKRLLIGGGIFAGLIVVLVVFMVVMGSLLGLKNITFDNGNGSKFSMKFYKKHHTASAQIQDKNTLKLISDVSIDSKAPVSIFIDRGTTTVSAETWQNSSSRNCSGVEPAFVVHNSNVNQDINVCLVSGSDLKFIPPQQGKDDVQYIGAIYYKDYIYPLVIQQDLDLSGISGGRIDPNTQKAAQDILRKTGLQVYKDDLKEIVASIKILN
jgi:hypothetical protein